MPDSSIMIALCNILDISVNDLLSGEKIETSKATNVADENLIKLKKEKETIIDAARFGFGISIILLFIYNMINVFQLGMGGGSNTTCMGNNEFSFINFLSNIFTFDK